MAMHVHKIRYMIGQMWQELLFARKQEMTFERDSQVLPT